MAHYPVTIIWQADSGCDFLAKKYSRAHTWQFPSGTTIAASSSPQIVPLPYSVEENVDPEEAYVASLSSCHMLWFLHLAANHKLEITSYIDRAVGSMAQNKEGKLWVTEVILKPEIRFAGDEPTREQLELLHHQAHGECFLANSVKTSIRVDLD